MPKLSAGILLFRISKSDVVEVLIVHPGGPFWANKDDGAWSIPKGEYLEGDDLRDAALREFHEELGSNVPSGTRLDLGELKQPSGKRIHVWAIEGDLDASAIVSNSFEMEWPPKSGKTSEFPEVDRAAWVSIPVASRKLLKGQCDFLPRLMDILGRDDRSKLAEGVDEGGTPSH
jgi:predicted NUDIX family NTP pyrophosphohydrolase